MISLRLISWNLEENNEGSKMLKFYHYPLCKKSRAELQNLKNKGIAVEVIDYFKKPLSEKELTDLLVRLNMKPKDIIRTQEALYKSNFKGKSFTDWEWVRILTENPRLIRRPIIVRDFKAVIGDSPANIDRLL
jgi:arsenate reductase